MSGNAYAPPGARVEDQAAVALRQFSWRAAALFALRFAGATAVSITIWIFILAMLKTHRQSSFAYSVGANLGYSLIAGLGALLWTWIVAALTAFLSRSTRVEKHLSSIALGVLFSLITLGLGRGAGGIGLGLRDSLLILGVWAVVGPVAATLFLMRPRSA